MKTWPTDSGHDISDAQNTTAHHDGSLGLFTLQTRSQFVNRDIAVLLLQILRFHYCRYRGFILADDILKHIPLSTRTSSHTAAAVGLTVTRHVSRVRQQPCSDARRYMLRYGPASQSWQPRTGSDGRTNPLCHLRLCTDSPNLRVGPHRTCCAGPKRPTGSSTRGAEPWRSDISEQRCADIGVSRWELLACAGHRSAVRLTLVTINQASRF